MQLEFSLLGADDRQPRTCRRCGAVGVDGDRCDVDLRSDLTDRQTVQAKSGICCLFATPIKGRQAVIRAPRTVAVSLTHAVDATLDPLDSVAASPAMKHPRKKSRDSHSLV